MGWLVRWGTGAASWSLMSRGHTGLAAVVVGAMLVPRREPEPPHLEAGAGRDRDLSPDTTTQKPPWLFADPQVKARAETEAEGSQRGGWSLEDSVPSVGVNEGPDTGRGAGEIRGPEGWQGHQVAAEPPHLHAACGPRVGIKGGSSCTAGMRRPSPKGDPSPHVSEPFTCVPFGTSPVTPFRSDQKTPS